MIITTRARAYVNYGRWIADCPSPYCGGAQALEALQKVFKCDVCHEMDLVEWPENADEIWAALNRRSDTTKRNWFPEGHELAIKARCPHGQSVDDLLAEQRSFEGD